MIDADGWDRPLLNAASKMATPFCMAYGYLRYRLVTPFGKFDTCDTIPKELAVRALILLSTVGSIAACIAQPALIGGVLSLGIGHKLLRSIAYAVQKDGYTHVRGNAPEIPSEEPPFITRNLCGPGGEMPKDHGGVNDWRDRIKTIADTIREENGRTLVLQEIYDTAIAEALIEELKDTYAHFFYHLGPSPSIGKGTLGTGGGIMVLTQSPVSRFESVPFDNRDWTLNRAFCVIELKDVNASYRLIGIHPQHTPDAKTEQEGEQLRVWAEGKRTEQMAQIVDYLAQERLAPLPTVLMGDYNIERDSAEARRILDPWLHPGYQGKEPTYTEELVKQWDPNSGARGESHIDDIRLFKEGTKDGRPLRVVDRGVSLKDHQLCRSFDDTFNTRTAISDHHGVRATLTFKNSKVE